jgi:hypothetical protein
MSNPAVNIQAAAAAGEALGRKAVYEAAKARIQAIQGQQGVAYKPGSTAPAPSVAAKNASKSPTLLSDIFGGEVIPGEEEVEGKLLNLAGNPPTDPAQALEQIPEKVAEGLLNLVKPIATKLTLYAVFILGGAAMILYGISKLLEPVGGPSLKSVVRKGAELGAAA